MKIQLAAAFAALALPAASAAADPPLRDAQALYDKLCKSCHGAEGKGNPTKAKTLKIDPELLDLTRPAARKLSREERRRILLEGKEKMPAYEKKLNPEEIDPLLDLVLQLRDSAAAKEAAPAP